MAGGDAKRLPAGAGHVDGRVGLLQRLRHHLHVAHFRVLAVEREPLAGPGQTQQFQRLLVPPAALVERNAGRRVQPGVAAPDAEDLNAIFRTAHSVKGGASTFGLTNSGVSEQPPSTPMTATDAANFAAKLRMSFSAQLLSTEGYDRIE